MMKKNKKPWYIWLSLLGFAILMIDTSRRIKFTKKNSYDNFVLWNRACLNFFKLVPLCVFIPPIVAHLFSLFFLPETMEESIKHEIVDWISILFFYLMGVYATYKHSIWREENISHLLGR